VTDDEIQISIAEACGWKWYRRPAMDPWAKKPMRSLYHPQLVPEYVNELQPADMTERECNPVFIFREGLIPDYPNDLNAMREAEETLTEHQREAYFNNLTEPMPWDFHGGLAWWSVHSTARQRAEAFLKTLNLWKETV